MASPISSVSDTLNDLLQSSGLNAITLNWNEFKRVTERERVKEAFKNELGLKMREHGLLLGYGAAVVIVAKDYKFAPVQLN